MKRPTIRLCSFFLSSDPTNPKHDLNHCRGAKRLLCSDGGSSPHQDPCTGQTEVWEQVLEGESVLGGLEGRGSQCPKGDRSWPQASVIPVLWEPRIRREERRGCHNIAGDAACAAGGWSLCSAFSSPFIALSESDKPLGSET